MCEKEIEDICAVCHFELGESFNDAMCKNCEYNPDIKFRCLNFVCNKENYVFRFGNFAYQKTYKYLEVLGDIDLNKNEILTELAKFS